MFRLLHILALFWMLAGLGSVVIPIWRWMWLAVKDTERQDERAGGAQQQQREKEAPLFQSAASGLRVSWRKMSSRSDSTVLRSWMVSPSSAAAARMRATGVWLGR